MPTLHITQAKLALDGTIEISAAVKSSDTRQYELVACFNPQKSDAEILTDLGSFVTRIETQIAMYAASIA